MATLQDRFNINSQLEHLQAKYIGTGHADLQRFEWAGGKLLVSMHAVFMRDHELLFDLPAAESQLSTTVLSNMP
jgi:splicing factor 3B subunit 5